MLHSRWKWLALLGLAASLAAVGWNEFAPATVRGLPAGDTLVYLNMVPLRQSGWLSLGGSQVQRSSAYAAFVQASGFDFERDLNQIALSLRGLPQNPDETTVLMSGRFSGALTSYMASHAQQTLTLGTAVGYQFPGWARPRQWMTIVPLSSHELLATNAPDPEAVLRQVAGMHLRPALWRPPFWSLPPVGYLAVDTLHLAAAQELDGSRPPFAGVENLHASLAAGAGLDVEATLATSSDAAAAATQAWLEQQQNQLRPLLAEDAHGGPTLRALLDRVEIRRIGATVSLTMHLDRTTLAQWRQAVAAR